MDVIFTVRDSCWLLLTCGLYKEVVFTVGE